MGYSFTHFATSIALAILSRLIDVVEWENKNKELWLVISRLILIAALVFSIKALYDLIKIGQIYWNYRFFKQ